MVLPSNAGRAKPLPAPSDRAQVPATYFVRAICTVIPCHSLVQMVLGGGGGGGGSASSMRHRRPVPVVVSLTSKRWFGTFAQYFHIILGGLPTSWQAPPCPAIHNVAALLAHLCESYSGILSNETNLHPI